MDTTQITAAQTQSQNQFQFDLDAFEEAVLRRDRKLAHVRKAWRAILTELAKASETLAVHFLATRHRVKR